MLRLFFSYSHKDEELRDELDKHLSILKRQGIIDVWHDRRITAGSRLDLEINENLRLANIILLLVSSDFLASDYCYDIEMKEAIKLHEIGAAVVIPIILRPCDWHATPFGHLLAVPKDGKPVSKFLDYDEAFLQITDEIKRVVNKKFDLKSTNPGTTLPKLSESRVSEIRSSNLRVKKSFSDHEKDKFLDEAFTYISNYFEQSLLELKKRNSQIDYRLNRMDLNSFSASLYYNGDLKSECMIFFGGMFGSRTISYSHQISSSRNSLNESLSITDDGFILSLKSMGMAFHGSGGAKALTFEGGAELYWQLFIRPMQ